MANSNDEMDKSPFGKKNKYNKQKIEDVYVNDDDIRYGDKMGTVLEDGDSVQIVPSIAGGH